MNNENLQEECPFCQKAKKAMDELIALGFDRILTSGQAANSLDGAATLKEMINYADGRIESNEKKNFIKYGSAFSLNTFRINEIVNKTLNYVV